jgi:CRP-like cAMP-binding protein
VRERRGVATPPAAGKSVKKTTMAGESLKSLTVPYRQGERIVVCGETGGCMFVVQSGSVRLSRPARDAAADAVEVAVLEKGDFFGESAVLEGKPYAVDAEAVCDCEIVEISASTLQRMLRANPEISVRLLRKLAGRVDRLETRLSTDDTGERPTPAPAAPAAAVASPARASGPRLVAEEGDGAFVLTGDEVLIGRYDPVTEIQPEIDLTELDTKRSVSRRHARLTRRKGIWYLSEEVGALNGTFVNGVKLLAGRGAPISDGDRLSLGMVRMVYKER